MGKWWLEIPWRMIQTNLRQIDMEDINAESFVEDLKKFDATVLLLNTAGIIASYKTNLKFHFQSEYLHGDSLRKIVDTCHKAGIRVIARTDFSKIRRPIYEQHPEWAYRTAEGKIVDYNGDVHACLNGAYQHDYLFEIVKEAVKEINPDGIFCNMAGFQVRDYSYNYHGICHCDSCKKLFRERFALELPKAEDLKDPAFRKYKVFQRERIAKHNERLYQHIKGLNPDLAVNGYDIQRMESNTEYKRPLPGKAGRWYAPARPPLETAVSKCFRNPCLNVLGWRRLIRVCP
jgi:beta-galactosidase GanA